MRTVNYIDADYQVVPTILFTSRLVCCRRGNVHDFGYIQSVPYRLLRLPQPWLGLATGGVEDGEAYSLTQSDPGGGGT